jgi:hypothetical protein
MTIVRPFAVLAAALTFAGASVAPTQPTALVSRVAAQEASASDFVRSVGNNVIEILKKEPPESRKQKLHDV